MPPLRADRPPKRFNQAVGALIREIRLGRRMSQRDLAAQTFLRPDSLSKYESGTHPPTVRSLSRIAQVLRVPVDCLLPELSFENEVDRDLYLHFRKLWLLPLESRSVIATLLSCLFTFNQAAPPSGGRPCGGFHALGR